MDRDDVLELLDIVRLATESQACFRSEILRRFDSFEDEMRARLDELDRRLKTVEENGDPRGRMLGSIAARIHDVETRVRALEDGS